ncbi:MAG TPA: hypothetical protein VGD79_06690 [Thermoanaerobaculia bacterium]|jgi:hypothetical protein
MKVYVIGAVYFNGCREEKKRAFAPDGEHFNPPHYASLWVSDAHLDRSATTWWPYRSYWHSDLGATEFRIPEAVDIAFPDGNGGANCQSLETTLAKLRKEKDGQTFEFEVDERRARAIARVEIHGGTIEGGTFDGMGVAEWTIDSPSGRVISVEPHGDKKRAWQIGLNGNDAEVVFSNMHHQITDAPGQHTHYRDRAAIFRELSGDGADATIAVALPTAPRNVMVADPVVRHFAHICNCSDKPCCCRNGGHPPHPHHGPH